MLSAIAFVSAARRLRIAHRHIGLAVPFLDVWSADVMDHRIDHRGPHETRTMALKNDHGRLKFFGLGWVGFVV